MDAAFAGGASAKALAPAKMLLLTNSDRLIWVLKLLFFERLNAAEELSAGIDSKRPTNMNALAPSSVAVGSIRGIIRIIVVVNRD